MKATILAVIVALLVGCATTQTRTVSTTPQEFVLKVQAAEPTKLTVEDAQEDKIIKSMEVKSHELDLSDTTFLCNGKAYCKLSSYISSYGSKDFWNDIIYLKENTDVREIHMYINSEGGSAFAGLALSDQIDLAEKEGFTIIAHASGIIASATVPIYASCTKRLAVASTMFMVHNPSIFKWAGSESASAIRAQNEMMELIRDRYLGMLAKNSNLSKEDWEHMEGRTTWFTTEQAIEYGIVDSIE